LEKRVKHSSHRHSRVRWAVGGALIASAVLVSVVPLLSPDADAGTGRVFTGIDARADGAGYLLSSARGEMYAFGGAGAVRNPVKFTGEIVDVALTADGRGAMAVSSAGQFYAYGTAKPQPNPVNFSGEIVGVALTADGQGAMAVSSAGQFYAYGTAKAQPNPVNFSGRIIGLALTADGRGVMAMSSVGQLYTYGTAKPEPNPTKFTGEMAGLDLTADGQGAVAVSSTGQVYAYGTAHYYGNGDPGCETYTGTQVCNDIRARYLALGGPDGPLGPPASGEFQVINGGLGQHFKTGSIYWSANTGAWDVRGVIRDKYFAMAAERGVLGMPVTGESFRNSTFGSHFANGAIYFSGDTGVHEVHGTINGIYSHANWADGTLGLPLTDELAANGDWAGGRISFFAGGYVFWDGRGTTRAGADTADDRRAAARSLQTIPLDDFIAVQRHGDGSKYHLDFSTDGCSSPGLDQVDKIFLNACIRHDFGNRNFGPKHGALDTSSTSLDRVNKTFLKDMKSICAKHGNSNTCRAAAESYYQAVYWNATNGKHWWR
jgi:Prokaryotic phospholipase A2/LGFP repeat